MLSSSPPDGPKGSAQALVEHLRQNPKEARSDPKTLAARFGLEPEFVRRALAGVPQPSPSDAARLPEPVEGRADALWRGIDAALERVSGNPVRFEALTLFGAVALLSATSWGVPARFRVAFLLFASAVMLVTVAVQMAAFYRRRMTRYALLGGLVFGLGTALPMMVASWLGIRRHPEEVSSQVTEGLVVFTVGLVMLMVGLVYGGIAAFLSLLGGWLHLRRTEREWKRLSRQQLLERYFDLRRRLDGEVATAKEAEAWEAWPIVAAIRRHPSAVAAGAGLVASLTGLAIGTALSGHASKFGDVPYVLLGAFGAIASFAILVLAAFLAGRSSRGAASGVAFALAVYAVEFLPVGGYGPASALAVPRVGLLALQIGGCAACGALAGVGAGVQRRAARERRRQRNDGATIVAEMLEIQWRLEEDATRVTVLVVDAAKSTAMKVGADPLDVEYSFREYQTWIASSCRGFGGRVHSVAGDGAIVAFSDAASAMAAARRILTDLPRFNLASNRLPKPFRLRLGMHAGRVAGDLDDVQFTEVIDIAAHVESIAPVGGIAATSAVVSSLGEEGFLPLARDVDGQGVSIALVPTEG